MLSVGTCQLLSLANLCYQSATKHCNWNTQNHKELSAIASQFTNSFLQNNTFHNGEKFCRMKGLLSRVWGSDEDPMDSFSRWLQQMHRCCSFHRSKQHCFKSQSRPHEDHVISCLLRPLDIDWQSEFILSPKWFLVCNCWVSKFTCVDSFLFRKAQRLVRTNLCFVARLQPLTYHEIHFVIDQIWVWNLEARQATAKRPLLVTRSG